MQPDACTAANLKQSNLYTPAFLQFCNPADLAAWCKREINEWYAQASQPNTSKAVSCDQEYREALIHFKPPCPLLPPLILLGGMGPLAGLRGLHSTICHLRHTREIIFYQACSLPCRSQVIQAQQSGDHSLYALMLRRLSAAIDYARGYLQKPKGCSLLLLCNTVHYFLPGIQHTLDRESIHVVSLIDAGIEAVKNHRGGKPLLLASPGTYLSGLYNESSAPIYHPSKEPPLQHIAQFSEQHAEQQHGVNFIAPNDAGKACLNRAIFDGIKGGCTRTALKWGEKLFEHLPYTPCTSILAACTEVPEFISLLREHASPDLRHHLRKLKVINPVDVAIKKLILETPLTKEK